MVVRRVPTYTASPMKTTLRFLATACFAAAPLISIQAQSAPVTAVAETVASPATASPGDPSPTPLGAEKRSVDFTHIQVKNFQDESLGRIKDLGIDLVNGRIVEVLVECDSSLELGEKKIVAVPPLALFPDQLNEVYRLNISTDVFKTAAAVDLSKWEDSGRTECVAAAYYLFGQEPYFLEEGDKASKTDQRPKVSLGYVERTVKILDLPVGNFQGVKFGKVWSLSLDIPNGRILNVIVIAPGNFKTKSVIPSLALSFNPKRDGLLLDDTKMEFADEPRYIFTEAAFGQDSHFQRESYKGPRTTVALEQGSRYRDVDRTVRINRDIRTAKINGRNVEVGTINDRVTLRGWVHSEDDKRRIGEIAIAAATLPENVDNQITVGKPVTSN
jgi:sporulation protein YlmC with PRC-barrel domain